MTFTDDDLRRLKEQHRTMTDMEFSESFEADKIDALIARMEAAEKALEFMQVDPKSFDQAWAAVQLWRKAAGK